MALTALGVALTSTNMPAIVQPDSAETPSKIRLERRLRRLGGMAFARLLGVLGLTFLTSSAAMEGLTFLVLSIEGAHPTFDL